MNNNELPCNKVLMQALIEYNIMSEKTHNAKVIYDKASSMLVDINTDEVSVNSHKIKTNESALIGEKYLVTFLGIEKGEYLFEIQEWVYSYNQTKVKYVRSSANSIFEIKNILILIMPYSNSVVLFEIK